jgi:two-component system, chemotaxis family, protein-glutamate methylesterase/glutaminase
MPASVLRNVGTDYCLPQSKIPELPVDLVAKGRPLKTPDPSAEHCEKMMREPSREEMESFGYTCPDCGGALLEIKDGKSMQFRCHVGHTFSLESFTESHADALERALWVALRKLNEQRGIQETLAKGQNGNSAPKKAAPGKRRGRGE